MRQGHGCPCSTVHLPIRDQGRYYYFHFWVKISELFLKKLLSIAWQHNFIVLIKVQLLMKVFRIMRVSCFCQANQIKISGDGALAPAREGALPENRHWKVWAWPGRKPNCPAFQSRPLHILAEWPSLSLLHSLSLQCLMYKVGPLTFMPRRLRRMNKVIHDVMFSLTVRQTFKKWCRKGIEWIDKRMKK